MACKGSEYLVQAMAAVALPWQGNAGYCSPSTVNDLLQITLHLSWDHPMFYNRTPLV